MKNNFTKRINKNITRFSDSQYYSKNLQWFQTASSENTEFIHVDGSQYPYFYPHFTLVGDFIDMKYFDLIGVRTSETAEWNFIPLPLLANIVYGKNIPKRTRVKKYINFISSCDFYTTRNEWEESYKATETA